MTMTGCWLEQQLPNIKLHESIAYSDFNLNLLMPFIFVQDPKFNGWLQPFRMSDFFVFLVLFLCSCLCIEQVAWLGICTHLVGSFPVPCCAGGLIAEPCSIFQAGDTQSKLGFMQVSHTETLKPRCCCCCCKNCWMVLLHAACSVSHSITKLQRTDVFHNQRIYKQLHWFRINKPVFIHIFFYKNTKSALNCLNLYITF